MQREAQPRRVVSFGPFDLVHGERLLLKQGVPVSLGGRAYDILAVLLERPGEVVSKSDLLARVWPDVTVDEGSLRYHIAALRKALGEGQDGARYVTNVPDRVSSAARPGSDLGKSYGHSDLDVSKTVSKSSRCGLSSPGRTVFYDLSRTDFGHLD